jgi:membrane protein YqaA with SNARE-associated domain
MLGKFFIRHDNQREYVMRLFSKLYERVMQWALHRHAQWYLAGLSFAESSFFPIPPDVMLAPMALAETRKAWRFAAIATLFSVIGGIAGYLIGVFAFNFVEPWILAAGYGDKYQRAVEWFNEWGIWTIFIAGFSPIPYKVFTIAAGVISMSFLPFVLASAVGRGARFFMVAALMVWGGERMEQTLRKHVDRLGWAMVVVIVMAIVLFK